MKAWEFAAIGGFGESVVISPTQWALGSWYIWDTQLCQWRLLLRVDFDVACSQPGYSNIWPSTLGE
jgi:hypothetical protein